MDWRDFFRGFFGYPQQAPPPHQDRNLWPPPPPISEFDRRRGHEEEEQDGDRGERGFWGGRRRPPSSHGEREGPEGFESRFVFGDLFSAMGEMFQEMERSMRDMEGFFENMKIDEDGRSLPFSNQLPLPPPPPEHGFGNEQESSVNGGVKSERKEDNVRDLVLKEPETPKRKHYIPKPAEEKTDRDLDELYRKSMLDLSDLPVPGSHQSSLVPRRGGAADPYVHSSSSFQFQRTHQTFSFKNGRWEGEIIKEDPSGKHVTRYYQDKDGQKHETTEFYPREKNDFTNPPAVTDGTAVPPGNDIKPYHGGPSISFLDRFFKPRM